MTLPFFPIELSRETAPTIPLQHWHDGATAKGRTLLQPTADFHSFAPLLTGLLRLLNHHAGALERKTQVRGNLRITPPRIGSLRRLIFLKRIFEAVRCLGIK
jgi:hypothetical protein